MLRSFYSVLFIVLLGCTAQKVQPTSPIYYVTITHTDNSQQVVGDNNKAEVKPRTDNRIDADIKPEIKANAESTTKNNMWIYWLIITVFAVVCGWFAWRRWGSV